MHLAAGRALAPLREEGVLVLGSGMSFHNLRACGNPASEAPSLAFDAWLGEAAGLPFEPRAAALAQWAEAPSARFCHPREEHLLPLHVCFGAAADLGPAQVSYRATLMGAQVSGFTWA